MNWFNKVIYQIYVRSFYDDSGAGIGGLSGITKKLPYIASLGVDYIWLNPFYPSPQNDNGYDVADYCAVDPQFGSLQDFDNLVRKARQYNIGIMLDMVFNHTSTEHAWFQQALLGDCKYKDYYYVRAAKQDGSAPNNWLSKFGGSAWEKLKNNSDEYYLHIFDKTQADLNWYNPDVRKELFTILDFWKARGVNAFRFDVINLIGKAEIFTDDERDADYPGDGRRFYTDNESAHAFISEMNNASLENGNLLTVGELSSTSPEHCVRYAAGNGNELSMAFHFHHLKCDYANGEKWKKSTLDFDALRNTLHFWQLYMAQHNAHDALFWNNHDQPRAITRFASKDPEYHFQSATLLAAAIHFMRGTPYIYMGEEIGMTNPEFNSIDEYRDVETLNYYSILHNANMPENEIMDLIKQRSRDNSRTPMQWDDGVNAGFSTVTPWISVNHNKSTVNVEAEEKCNNGVLAFYKKLIKLRKQYAVIQNGSYTPMYTDIPGILAYKRSLDGQMLLSIHNFFAHNINFKVTDSLQKTNRQSSEIHRDTVGCIELGHDYQVLASNYGVDTISSSEVLTMRAYETLTILMSLINTK